MAFVLVDLAAVEVGSSSDSPVMNTPHGQEVNDRQRCEAQEDR